MRVLLLCILFTISFAECPQGCADAIALPANKDSVCAGANVQYPSPCTQADAASCALQVTTACADSSCPANCRDAIALPANKDSLCADEMVLPSPCIATDVTSCFLEIATACPDPCPSECAAAIANPANRDSFCTQGEQLNFPSPCVDADILTCATEATTACASSGEGSSGEGSSGEAGVCTGTQQTAALAALQASTTTECQTVVTAIDGDGPNDAQLCACFGSGTDFSALSSYDCKFSSDDSQNVSAYVAGTGVCAEEEADTTATPAGDSSSSSALSLFFAFAALFFGLA